MESPRPALNLWKTLSRGSRSRKIPIPSITNHIESKTKWHFDPSQPAILEVELKQKKVHCIKTAGLPAFMHASGANFPFIAFFFVFPALITLLFARFYP